MSEHCHAIKRGVGILISKGREEIFYANQYEYEALLYLASFPMSTPTLGSTREYYRATLTLGPINVRLCSLCVVAIEHQAGISIMPASDHLNNVHPKKTKFLFILLTVLLH